MLVPLAGDWQTALIERSVGALCDTEKGFAVTACYGVVSLLEESSDPSGALRLADERLYAQKRAVYGRRGTDHPHLRELSELDPGPDEALSTIPGRSTAVAGRGGLSARAPRR